MNTAEAIQGAHMSHTLKQLAEAVRAETTVPLDIDAANLSLEEKAVLRSAVAGAATRIRVAAALIDPPLELAVLGS
jgi:hypothetical protein